MDNHPVNDIKLSDIYRRLSRFLSTLHKQRNYQLGPKGKRSLK